MNKLSRQKRSQFILAVVMTLAVVSGMYFTIIRQQSDRLRRLDSEKVEKETRLASIRDTKKNCKRIEADLVVVSNQLQAKEDDMAFGDLYSTMISIIDAFRRPYNVDIPQFTPGGPATDVNLLPKFPYKQVTITIGGTAYYSDLGQFIAGFENRFPGSRVLNLELTPVASMAPEERERLQFKMDIVSLVRPGGTRTVVHR